MILPIRESSSRPYHSIAERKGGSRISGEECSGPGDGRRIEAGSQEHAPTTIRAGTSRPLTRCSLTWMLAASPSWIGQCVWAGSELATALGCSYREPQQIPHEIHVAPKKTAVREAPGRPSAMPRGSKRETTEPRESGSVVEHVVHTIRSEVELTLRLGYRRAF